MGEMHEWYSMFDWDAQECVDFNPFDGDPYTRDDLEPLRGLMASFEAGERLSSEDYARVRGAAVSTVAAAVKAGRLKKLPCAKCGKRKYIEAHHHRGYRREYWLDVVWLCRSCHRAEHARLRGIAAMPKLHARK